MYLLLVTDTFFVCRYEFFFGGMSSSNLCVTQAMKRDLWEHWGIRWGHKLSKHDTLWGDCLALQIQVCSQITRLTFFSERIWILLWHLRKCSQSFAFLCSVVFVILVILYVHHIPEINTLKVPLWSNSPYPFFYIFTQNRSFLDFLPNFNLLRTLELMSFGPLFPRTYGCH